MPKSKIDPVLFRKLWLEGKKVREIAKAMGVSDLTIMDWRRKLGLPSRLETARQRKEIFKQLFLEGKTYREISEVLGVRIETVMLWRKKLGLPPRVKFPSPKEKAERELHKFEIHDRLLALVQEKGIVNVDEAAKLLDTDRSLINDLIRENRTLEKLPLCFARSASSRVIPTTMFGDLTAKQFVYCPDRLEPVKQFLIGTIKQNLKRPLTRGEVLALRHRLEGHMRLPREAADDIICSLTDW